jgi:hypothetical protein
MLWRWLDFGSYLDVGVAFCGIKNERRNGDFKLYNGYPKSKVTDHNELGLSRFKS